MTGEEAVIAALVLGSGMWMVRPLIGAAAKRIAGEHQPPAPDPLHGDRDEILGELQALRQEMAELQERLDFAERLLARQREPDRLAPPR